MSFIFFWVFLVQTHFPSIVSPVFLFFGSTSVAPTNPKELRLTRRCSPQNCETRSAQPVDVWDAVQNWWNFHGQPTLPWLAGFSQLNAKISRWIWRWTLAGDSPCRRLQPLRTFKVGEPQSSKTWRLRRLPWGKLTESDPSEAKKRGLVRCDCLKALKE